MPRRFSGKRSSLLGFFSREHSVWAGQACLQRRAQAEARRWPPGPAAEGQSLSLRHSSRPPGVVQQHAMGPCLLTGTAVKAPPGGEEPSARLHLPACRGHNMAARTALPYGEGRRDYISRHPPGRARPGSAEPPREAAPRPAVAAGAAPAPAGVGLRSRRPVFEHMAAVCLWAEPALLFLTCSHILTS